MRSSRTLTVLAVGFLLLVVKTACDVSLPPLFPPPGGDESRTGTLRVLVTDKPFPFEFIQEAVVTITRVEVRVAGNTNDNGDDDTNADENANSNDNVTANENDNTSEVDLDGDDDGDVVEDPDDGDEDMNAEDVDDDADDMDDVGDDAEDDSDELDDVGDDAEDDSDELDDVGDDAEDDSDDMDDVGDDAADTQDDADDMDVDSDDADEDADDMSDDADADDDGPFRVIFEGERLFNLLDLQNGRTDLLADAEIPAGTYTQMRLVVTEGTVVLNDEAMTEFRLRVPSGEQSGIKLNFTFEVEADQETVLLLDVDLSRAFSAMPSGRIDDVNTIRGFRFHPAPAMRLINMVDAGSISGVVTDEAMNPLEDVAVTAYVGEQEVTSTSTDADGTYVLGGLLTDDYRVEFSAVGFQNFTVASVSVTAGQTTENISAVLSAEGSGL